MRWGLALCAILLAAPALSETATDRFAPRKGLNFEIWALWLSAEEMVATDGFLDEYPDWRRNVRPELIAALAEVGFDFVRLPMDPAPLLRLGPGPAQDALIAQIAEGAALVQAAGLKAIVDMHSIPRPDEVWGTDSIVGDPQLFAAHVALVGKVAAALHGMDPDRTALELLNEPTNDCDAIYSGQGYSGQGYSGQGYSGQGDMQWPGQLDRLYQAARTNAPDLPLVLSGACWGGARGLSVLDPTRFDANVLFSFHSYDPFLFTHQGAVWTDGPNLHFTDVPYPPDVIDDALAAQLVDQAAARAGAAMSAETLAEAMAEYRSAGRDGIGAELALAAAWADRNGIPRGRLILGEFGAIREDIAGNRLATAPRDRFLHDKRDAAEALGIGWAVWDWTGSFGIVADDSRRDIAPATCAALGLTC